MHDRNTLTPPASSKEEPTIETGKLRSSGQGAIAVLAFDTCLDAVSVALRWQNAGGQILVHEAYEERRTGHAERLFPMIAEAMAGAGLKFGDLARVAVTIGPGTFTGVRTGVTAARALSLSARVPLCAMTSLALIAQNAVHLLGRQSEMRRLAVAVDARRGALYFQVFSADGKDPLCQPRLTTPEAAAMCLGFDETVVVGSGAELLAQAAVNFGARVVLKLGCLQPHARELAMLGLELTSMDPIRPLYLRVMDVRPQEQRSLT
jgi:tRNA threonylcarbamoyladenosine biosynthesis protein TsaB